MKQLFSIAAAALVCADGKATEHWEFMQPVDIKKMMAGPQKK